MPNTNSDAKTIMGYRTELHERACAALRTFQDIAGEQIRIVAESGVTNVECFRESFKIIQAYIDELNALKIKNME